MTTVNEYTGRSWPNYNAPLKTASEWLRGHDPQGKADAVTLLLHLRKRFSHALPVGTELVLALLETGNEAEAMAELRRLQLQFRELDEEAYGRFGKYYKAQGWAAWKANQPAVAEQRFRASLEQYKLGYAVREGHDPAVNSAAILLFLAAVTRKPDNDQTSHHFLGESKKTAELLLKRHPWPTTLDDDNIWHLATEGEVYLILGRWDEAVSRYQSAMKESNVLAFHPRAIRFQAVWLLRAWQTLGVEIPVDRFVELFGSIEP
jgi:tetratricopeptide (TPR) repeat protein